MSKKFLKLGVLVSGLIFIFCVLGLICDMIVVSVLGVGVMLDVFFFVNCIFNFLCCLFVEGVFFKVFVFVLVEYNFDNDLNKICEFVVKVLGLLGLVVFVVILLVMIGLFVVVVFFGIGWFMDWFNGGVDVEKFI